MAFFGVASADGRVNTPIGDVQGVPVYQRVLPQGFFIVLEAKPGPSGRPVGQTTFNHSPSDPNTLPDFQIISLRPLGNGSTAVCDTTAPGFIGGVPAVNPPMFGGSQMASNAINDFACRFDARRMSTDACTRNIFQEDRFVTTGAGTVQFCSTVGVGGEIAFPPGDTQLFARVRDNLGQPGLPASMIIRVVGD